MLPCGMKDASLSLERRVATAITTRRILLSHAWNSSEDRGLPATRPRSSCQHTVVLQSTHRTAQPDALRSSAHHAALLSLFPCVIKAQHPGQPSQRQNNTKSAKAYTSRKNRHNNLFMNHLSRAHPRATSRNPTRNQPPPPVQQSIHPFTFSLHPSVKKCVTLREVARGCVGLSAP